MSTTEKPPHIDNLRFIARLPNEEFWRLDTDVGEYSVVISGQIPHLNVLIFWGELTKDYTPEPLPFLDPDPLNLNEGVDDCIVRSVTPDYLKRRKNNSTAE